MVASRLWRYLQTMMNKFNKRCVACLNDHFYVESGKVEHAVVHHTQYNTAKMSVQSGNIVKEDSGRCASCLQAYLFVKYWCLKRRTDSWNKLTAVHLMMQLQYILLFLFCS